MSLEISDLTKRFNASTVLNQISLATGDGEFVALVGPSGAGKSTLLRLIAGLEEPDSGLIRIREQAVADLPPRERNVAMVFQGDSLYPHLSVRKNLEFPLSMRGVTKEEIDTRVAAIAQQFELHEWLDRDPATLSGGQRQRVAIGRAMIRDPAVCLLDEPFSHLDIHLRKQMRRELVDRRRAWSATTLFVTHDLDEAFQLGERVAVMGDGVIHQFGSPEEIRCQPANAFVAEFVEV